MIVGLWQGKGLMLFELMHSGVRPFERKKGALRSTFKKRVLVLGRENVYYTTRTYPKAPLGKLEKAIATEIPTFFNVSNFGFYYLVREESERSSTVDLWVYDSSKLDELKRTFSFQYVIPEDLLWLDDGSFLVIYRRNGFFHLIAVHNGALLGSLTTNELSEKIIDLFLTGLLPYSEDIQTIKLFGVDQSELKVNRKLEFHAEFTEAQLISRLAKKRELLRKIPGPRVDGELLIRLGIYLFAGYLIFLLSTAKNYEKRIEEVRGLIKGLDLVISKARDEKDGGGPLVIAELKDKLLGVSSPSEFLEELARVLPEGCVVEKVSLTERKAEVLFTHHAPLEVVQVFEGSSIVKSAQLKGAPIREGTTKNFRFTVIFELRPYAEE
ncbi:MAG: hypothetical protein QW658_00330 [Candidatus Bathyarchaeia archaeon]